jgi:transcriptional regulator with XRE-family HTH domain
MKGHITQTIQRAVVDSGILQSEIARQAKVTEGQLSRFLRDKRSLTLPAAERLCKVLGLELRPVSPRKAR